MAILHEQLKEKNSRINIFSHSCDTIGEEKKLRRALRVLAKNYTLDFTGELAVQSDDTGRGKVHIYPYFNSSNASIQSFFSRSKKLAKIYHAGPTEVVFELLGQDYVLSFVTEKRVVGNDKVALLDEPVIGAGKMFKGVDSRLNLIGYNDKAISVSFGEQRYLIKFV